MRDEFGLSYAEIGLLLAIPGLVGNAFDPVVGALGDTHRRRALLIGGGLAFAAHLVFIGASVGFWTLLAALILGNPATGAFVSLAQATLMDRAPERRERNMAWWTLAGSGGYAGGPLVLTVALWAGLGWRAAFFGLAVVAAGLVVFAARGEYPAGDDGYEFAAALKQAVRAFRDREVWRWLGLLEAADLLLDVLFGFLALYLVDVAGWTVVEASLGVAVWTGAGLVGDALLIPVLACVPGTRYLRVSALAVFACYPAFLLVPGFWPRVVLLAVLGLLNSGWYAVPKAGLYSALPGRSGAAVAVGGIAGFAGLLPPLAMGYAADVLGLAPSMWMLLIAPVAMLLLLPRR